LMYFCNHILRLGRTGQGFSSARSALAAATAPSRLPHHPRSLYRDGRAARPSERV
jgi:hypothetical protein